MAKDVLDTQEFYELMQQYRHCNFDNQELVIEKFENVKSWIRENVQGNVHNDDEIKSGMPEWLTPEIRKQVKETWDSHKDVNDGFRVKAMLIIRKAAKDMGYVIDVKKSMELMKEYCNLS